MTYRVILSSPSTLTSAIERSCLASINVGPRKRFGKPFRCYIFDGFPQASTTTMQPHLGMRREHLRPQ